MEAAHAWTSLCTKHVYMSDMQVRVRGEVFLLFRQKCYFQYSIFEIFIKTYLAYNIFIFGQYCIYMFFYLHLYIYMFILPRHVHVYIHSVLHVHYWKSSFQYWLSSFLHVHVYTTLSQCYIYRERFPNSMEKKHDIIAHQLLKCECNEELPQLALHQHQLSQCVKRSVKCQFPWCQLVCTCSTCNIVSDIIIVILEYFILYDN